MNHGFQWIVLVDSSLRPVSPLWCFLISYMAFSAYNVDYALRIYLEPQFIHLYHLQPQVFENYKILTYISEIFGVVIFSCMIDRLSFRSCFIWAAALQLMGLYKFAQIDPSMPIDLLRHDGAVGSLFIGLGEGGIIAIVHPLIVQAFHRPGESKFKILNYFYTNGPLISGLMGVYAWYLADKTNPLSANIQLLFIFPCIYLCLALILPLPRYTANRNTLLSSKLRALMRPGFVLLLFCMILTATISQAPKTFLLALSKEGLHSSQLNFVIYYNLIFFMIRLSSGLFTRFLSPPVLLMMATILCCLSLYAMSFNLSTLQFWVAIGCFATSIAWFWPSFITIAVDRYPLSGSFGMGFINIAGYFSYIASIPFITKLALMQGYQTAFYVLAWFGALTFVMLIALNSFFRSQGGYKVMSAAGGSY